MKTTMVYKFFKQQASNLGFNRTKIVWTYSYSQVDKIQCLSVWLNITLFKQQTNNLDFNGILKYLNLVKIMK